MRGVAALSVLVGHTLYFGNPSWGQIRTFGFWMASLGVVIFFAISGFLLYRPFVAARGTSTTVGSVAPSFLLRRAVRILPAYWVALTVLAIWPGLTGVFSSHWWVYYGLLEVYSPTWLAGGLAPAWSLCVELTFYLALPLIALFLASRGVGSLRRGAWRWEVGALAGLAAGSLIWVAVFNADASTAYLSENLLATFIWFSSGMLIAAMQVSHPPNLARLLWFLGRPELCWPLALGILALLQFNVFIDLGMNLHLFAAVRPLDLALVAALLVSPAMLGDAGRLVNWVLANRVAVFLGTISYGIYLWHFPILIWLLGTGFVATSPAPVLVTLAITLTAAIALGSASWYLIEKPLMRRVRSTMAQRRIGRAAPPPEPVPARTAELDGSPRAPASSS
jgi:peptidoglycan/LPS O-acetylase OafA/YrhL